MIHVLPLVQATPQPWRNGGGSTRELLAWPAGDWQCRISVAEIAQDGPFSAFPGIQRWFAVVEGAGVDLQFDSGTRRLQRGDAPLQFDGAAAPGCVRVDGTTLDLNLMLRQAAGSGSMQHAVPGADWHSAAPLRALFCSGPARLSVDGEIAAQLDAAALAFSTQAAQQRWRLHAVDGGTLAWWLSFQPHTQR